MLPRPLSCEADIRELHSKAEGSVTEEELREVLRRYNLRDGLISLGQASLFVFNDQSENKIGKTAYRDPETTVIITQFALAYLATALINSGANDYKAKILGAKDNVLTLCNLYSNSLVSPETRTDKTTSVTHKDIASLMVRMFGEQFEYQFDYILFVARNIVIFTEIINEIPPKKFKPLSEIFEKETGLSIQDYLWLVIAVWATAIDSAKFRKEHLTEAQIPSMQHVLTDEKVTNFLEILSADYNTFRAEDRSANINLDPVFTKFRFNPLLVYPIIKTDKEDSAPYVIPNTMAYLKKGYGGLYWWFCRYFEEQGKRMDFTNYFGEVFEAYVGKILKQMYIEANVHPEINYPNGKFIDWWVEKDSKIYLFEAKSYQFARPTKQTGDIELIAKEVKTKIVESIEQVYKRLEDIAKYSELEVFRGKTLIPVVVFMEIPLVSAHLYRELNLWDRVRS
jgi:hypothetical protein